MKKFNPPPPPEPMSEPVPQVSRKQFVLAQKFEDMQQNKFSDFNNKPRGWNSGDARQRMNLKFSLV